MRIVSINCALLAVGVACGSSWAQTPGVTRRSVQALPSSTTTDQSGQSFTIGGLSGISYAGGSSFWAVMDNSDKLVRLEVTFGSDGSIVSSQVAGGLRVAQVRDHEGIGVSSGGTSAFVSEESTPAVHEYRLSDGTLLRTLPLPTVYAMQRANLGLESLSRSGNALWTANEEALIPDGPLSDESNGSTVRLQHLSLSSSVGGTTAGPQYAYRTAPIHRDAKDVPPREASDTSRSGLVDLVALPNGSLLALERSFARADAGFLTDAASEFQSRLYWVNTAGATDVSGFSTLDGQPLVPVSKTLLWSYTTGLLSNPRIGNLEGLTLGPKLPNGNHVLLGVVDNGDGALSGNTLVSFELTGVIPEPATALSAGAIAGVLLCRRRFAPSFDDRDGGGH